MQQIEQACGLGWLRNAARSAGVWLVYDKGSKRSLPYDAIVEEALSFGWVDSRPRRLSDDQAMLYLAPRRPTSNWSRINKERVLSLRTQGLMTPAGEAAVETAVRNGHWEALAEVEELLEPGDLRQRLDTDAARAATGTRSHRQRVARFWNGSSALKHARPERNRL